MPIQIDTSADLSQQTSQIAITRKFDAKYFSKALSGSPKRKTGLLGVDSNTIEQFMKEKRRLLDTFDPNYFLSKTQHAVTEEHFGNLFFRQTPEKKEEFRHFEKSLLTVAPPALFNHLMRDNQRPCALTLPGNTALYDLNDLENDEKWFPISRGLIDNEKATTYVRVVIESVDLFNRQRTHEKNGVSSNTNQVAGVMVNYLLTATVLDARNDDADIILMNEQVQVGGKTVGKPVNARQGVLSITPVEELTRTEFKYINLMSTVKRHIDNRGGQIISNQNVLMGAITDIDVRHFMEKQSVTDILTHQAENMSQHADEIILTVADTFARHASRLMKKSGYSQSHTRKLIQSTIAFIQCIDVINDIETDLVTTRLLTDIYASLSRHIQDEATVNAISRHSLRLLLSQRLHQLNEIKESGGLYKFDPKNQAVTAKCLASDLYSSAQKALITSTEPLLIGQAGAGSGKSHTLGGRVYYMTAQGEDLSKALVLSFTNVSADNIKQRFPGIASQTLAKMFDTIYKGTFPVQTLSSPSTVANSIRLVNPESNYFTVLGFSADRVRQFGDAFANTLEKFDQSGYKRVNMQQEIKRLSNLMEGNIDIVTALLNAVEQTTLEIQPIVIHHMLLNNDPSLQIPVEYQNLNYIITDESQDISTFEYILLLELTIHYRSQLFIIGDGSQTLYEFRNSDPRYMNALESSGVFMSHKLETNYRSDAEILLFANRFLEIIDANKHANIRLNSSVFRTPTEASFRDAVTIEEHVVQRKTKNAYNESLKRFFEESDAFEAWFVDRMRKGEQVAIMAWTRSEVLTAGEAIADILARNGLNIPVTNIMKDKEQPMTLLSKFARVMHEDIRATDPNPNGYLDKIAELVQKFINQSHPNAEAKQSGFYLDYITRNIKAIIDAPEWSAVVSDFNRGALTAHQVGSQLIQMMLRRETRQNSVSKFINADNTSPNYDACQIILSTIHGTKGLEFDHTVVMFNESKRGATSQESLRMLFVALSRAKKSEYIINSHLASGNRVVSDNLNGMFQTPMPTAYLRTLSEVEALNAPATPVTP